MGDWHAIRVLALLIFFISALSTTLLTYNMRLGSQVVRFDSATDLVASRVLLQEGRRALSQPALDAIPCAHAKSNQSELALASILTCADSISSVSDNYLWSAMKLVTSVRKNLLPGEAIDAILLLAGCEDMGANYKSLLRRAGWSLCHVPAIPGPKNVPHDQNRFLATDMFSKLHAWRLEQYAWVFLVDADTMVLHPFVADVMLAARNMQANNMTLGAAPQLATSCGFFDCLVFTEEQCPLVRDERVGFNAGVMLIRPDNKVFRWLTAQIDVANYDIEWAEQGLLNALYPPGMVFELESRFNHMTFQNPCGMSSWKSLFENNITIIHFTNPKPWDCGWNAPWETITFDTSATCALWEGAPIFFNHTIIT